jgi:dienelactone hydrolase
VQILRAKHTNQYSAGLLRGKSELNRQWARHKGFHCRAHQLCSSSKPGSNSDKGLPPLKIEHAGVFSLKGLLVLTMKRLFPVLLALASTMTTRAAIHTETVEYKQGDTTLEGFLAYDDSPTTDQSEHMRQLTALKLDYAAMSSELEKLKSLDKDKLKNVLPTIVSDPQFNDDLAKLRGAETYLASVKKSGQNDREIKRATAIVDDLNLKVNDRIEGLLTSFQISADATKAKIATLEKEISGSGKTVSEQVFTNRPGVLIVHQWMGLTDYEKKRAEMLAQLGYVAFCADIYGKGVRPQTTQEAGVLADKYKNGRQLLRARVNAGLDTLRQQPLVDAKRIAAIGYCFGGTTAIELARSSADIAGVVSFHGGLDSPTPADGKNIKCKLLVCHGADDPFEKPDDLAAFENEMRNAGVDWRLIQYGGAVHAFTQWNAGNDNSKGAAYNERADKRSWEDMKLFFAEIFE